MPGIAVWPGTVAPHTVSQDLVSTMDIFATMMDVAGVPLPADRVMDSHSLRPLLTGTGQSTRNSSFFYRGCTLAAVRHKQYKMHVEIFPPATQPPAWSYPGATPMLFQIEQDPSERFPLVDGQEDVIAEINGVIATHRAQLGTPPPPILFVGGGAEVCCDEARNCSCTPPPMARVVAAAGV